jgi:cytochrome c oxidase subunit II
MAFEHSSLDPAGPMAASIAQLWWVFVGVSAVVYLVVIAFLLLALVRRRRAVAATERGSADGRSLLMVSSAVGLTIVILITLAVSDFIFGRVLANTPADPLRVQIIGHQWWWEVDYEDAVPSKRLHTANELHIPVGRPVEVKLKAQDVIHSFWIPNLQGKRDMMPGRITHTVLKADRPGVYGGQCAEFCGYQHAKMKIVVHAETPERYAAWRAAQLEPARMPATAQQQRGQQVFLSTTCIMCHSIQGTPAGGTVAPDLTHVASRDYIAAGALRNTPTNMASWILNPQSIKPGTQMPATALSGDDLGALTTYLESLK